MPKLSLFAIGGLTIILTFSPMIFFVAKELRYKRNDRNLLPYLIYLISILFWGIASFLIGLTQDYSYAKYLWKYAYAIVVFISVFFYHALISVNNLKRPKTLIFLYASGVVFALLTLNNFLPGHPKLIFDSVYYPQRNILFDIHFTLWSLTIFCAYIEISILLRKSINTKQNLILLLGSPIAFLGGLLNHGNSYGIPIYPIGNFFVAASSLIYTYAILRHEFLDIKIIIRRSLAYSLLITVMTILYFLSIFLSEKVLQSILGYKTFIGSLIGSLILAFTFIPLKNYFQKLVDKIILGKAPSEIAEENDKLQQELSRREKYTMAAKLAGNVAHEIKNPLTAIKTFVEQFPHKKNDQEFLDKFQKLASVELTRIHNLSLQLMDFAKPAELKLSTFDVHQVLDDVLLLTNQRLQQKNIHLDKHLASESLTLTGDQDQLKQVFLNLVLNAVDAMENGGMLTVETIRDQGLVDGDWKKQQPPTSNPHSPTPNHIKIIISDTGCGISPENLKKLFEPFFTTKHDGTGLGLSICKRIIENHGGMIEVKSEINKGTAFSIILPVTSSGGIDA